jgi:hypothetical protein
MAKQHVLINKVKKHEYILEVDRGLSTEYYYYDDGNFYSIVENSEGVISDYGESPASGFRSTCQECADGEKDYEVIAPIEFFRELGERLMKGDTDFAHKFGGI